MTNPLFMCESAEWYSPARVVECARTVMGGIDLDPASTAKANKFIRATHFYTKEDDGLVQRWGGRLWLNPPGDKQGMLPKAFWSKLCQEFVYGDVHEAVYLGFNLEQLVSLQSTTVGELVLSPSPLYFPMCVPKRRLAYSRSDGTVVKSNTHGSFISYLGWRPQRFARVFEEIGDVR
jgi:ParB family chromosome partitioning protein